MLTLQVPNVPPVKPREVFSKLQREAKNSFQNFKENQMKANPEKWNLLPNCTKQMEIKISNEV